MKRFTGTIPHRALCGLLLTITLLAGCTPADEALMDAIDRQEIGTVERLLQKDIALNKVVDGYTLLPLEAAVARGNGEIVRLLVKAGANPDTSTGTHTPLWQAMEAGNEAAAVALVHGGARIDGPPVDKHLPFYYAVMQEDYELVSAMIAYGADVHTPGPWGTPLHEAVDNQMMKMVVLLLANSADVNRPNEFSEPPIFLAFEKDSLTIAEHLVRSGADINYRNDIGETVLHVLAKGEEQNEEWKIAKAVEWGADVEIENDKGETPLKIARNLENVEAENALLEAGAER